MSEIEVLPPKPSGLGVNNARPPDVLSPPERKLLVVEAIDRGTLFVSWLTVHGVRYSAEVAGGFKNAERVAGEVSRKLNPTFVAIGREAYEGLPPKPTPTQIGVAT